MQRPSPVSRLNHQRSDVRRYGTSDKSITRIYFGAWLVALVIFCWQREHLFKYALPALSYDDVATSPRPFPRLRPFVYNLSDFGAVGDGKTLNSAAFEEAIAVIRTVAKEGGGQLNVGSGRWLTAPFNLTSHMTLFLAHDAVILGTEDESNWPVLPPLPSYGRGRELPGPRYGSLLYGENLEDILITGYNGTVDGQGQSWWRKHKEGKSIHTRPCLIELLWSKDIVISDVTLQNSPFWTLHPYACNNVTIRGITVLAPVDSPNTDGIDPGKGHQCTFNTRLTTFLNRFAFQPVSVDLEISRPTWKLNKQVGIGFLLDSCQDMIIEDSYISAGDDSIAIKSGWDQYGIAYGRPSSNIVIRNVVVHSPISAGVSIGSEMSGGVTNILVQNLVVWDSRRGVRIKTSAGRGGYVTNIMCRNLRLENVRVGIVIKTDYGEHPDDQFDPVAYPTVANISYHGVHGKNVRIPVKISGSKEIPITGVEFKDVDVGVTRKKKHIFQCSFVQGRVMGKIHPSPCQDLVKYEVASR